MIYLLIGKISSDTLQLLTTQHMYVWLFLAKSSQMWPNLAILYIRKKGRLRGPQSIF